MATPPVARDYAQKMRDWRLSYVDETLTGYRASLRGLGSRA
jgi:hypothetical protein